MILCSAEPRIISCLPTHVINLVINDNSLEILYVYYLNRRILHPSEVIFEYTTQREKYYIPLRWSFCIQHRGWMNV